MRIRWLPWRHERPDPEEAKQATREAVEDLGKALRRWPEVTRVADSLGRATQRNHFSEAMERLAEELKRSRHA